MSWALLAARMAVAAVYLYAGAVKVADPAGFAEAIARYQLTPDWFNGLASRWLPWLEILAGLSLASGTLTRGGAGILAGLSALFAAAVASAVVRGLDVSCGCGLGENEVGWLHVVGNVVALGICLAVTLGERDRLRLDSLLAPRSGRCAFLFGAPAGQAEAAGPEGAS